MSGVLTGSCLCGAVHYRVRGEPHAVTHCHCASCRKASGAAFVTWFTVRTHEVEWRGEARLVYHSSAAVERGFCPRCGSTLSYAHASDPALLDLTVSSLDVPELLIPMQHAWWSERVAWADPRLMADLPVFGTEATEVPQRAHTPVRQTSAVAESTIPSSSP